MAASHPGLITNAVCVEPVHDFVTYKRGFGYAAHAYARCRSNKGAPGVDGQDFTDIEATKDHILGTTSRSRGKLLEETE